MKRKIYNELIKWKKEDINTPLMVVGARQIGKTYTIDEFCKNEFTNYIYINLLNNKEIIEIFKENINTEEKIKKMELSLGHTIDYENTIIFFDEIQESEELISALKFFCESKVSYKIICAGSLLGVKINRFHSSFPVGKVRIINMYPMNFEEFLWAMDYEIAIPEIKRCYQENVKMSDSIHEKLLNYYRMFLCVGGMPRMVLSLKETQKILEVDKSIASNIYKEYLMDMNKYVTNVTEGIKNETIYNSIPSQLANLSNKFQYGKINNNARKRDYETSLDWLISSKMVLRSNLVKKVEIPLKAYIDDDYFKLYLSDIGLLVSILEIRYNDIMLNKEFMYKGVLAENYVATELIHNYETLYYWQSENRAEIDFLINAKDGIIPIEVKANTNNNNNSKSLNLYMEKYKPSFAIRISSKNFGFENNIKSVPLYATFCISEFEC